MLFNIYVSDMPGTTSTKFASYADELALAIQSIDFDTLNSTLTEDMKKMDHGGLLLLAPSSQPY